jgi:hypothetical protein
MVDVPGKRIVPDLDEIVTIAISVNVLYNAAIALAF